MPDLKPAHDRLHRGEAHGRPDWLSAPHARVPRPRVAPAIEFQQFATHLGSWRQAVWAPPELAGWVRAIWYLEGDLTHPFERSFPPGAVDLVVHLDGGLSAPDAVRADRVRRAEVVGQITRAMVIAAPDHRSAVLGIRLDPAGACVLFEQPIHELTGETVSLADVNAEATEQLVEVLAGAASASDAMNRAACWLSKRIGHRADPDPAIRRARDQITETGGRIRIASLSDRAGMSRTRFTTAFRELVGISPKALARVARFQHALALVRNGAGGLTDIALCCGYYDQAHFTNEFRAMSGYTPGKFPSARLFPASTTYMAEPVPEPDSGR